MTPEDEAVALRWVSARLRTHVCGQCGGTWVTAASTSVLFHRCANATNGQRPTTSYEQAHAHAQAQWARSVLGYAFEDAIDRTIPKEKHDK